MFEHYFDCPYCGADISMLLDLTVEQCYIEDCEVCCNPIEVSYAGDGDGLRHFSAFSIEQ